MGLHSVLSLISRILVNKLIDGQKSINIRVKAACKYFELTLDDRAAQPELTID
jgi:hypothetical protein